MTGGSRAHQRIVFNLIYSLEDNLDPAQFDPVQGMRVDVGGKIRYPDISVCAGIIPGKVKTLRDAIVTFDVLSDETADTDRDQKRHDYARLPGIQTYVLL
jgi:Uma2 family endonuclease